MTSQRQNLSRRAEVIVLAASDRWRPQYIAHVDLYGQEKAPLKREGGHLVGKISVVHWWAKNYLIVMA